MDGEINMGINGAGANGVRASEPLRAWVDGLSGAAAGIVAGVQPAVALVSSSRQRFGAGVVWRPDGLIVTNHHILHRGRLRVTLADGSEYSARILARDPHVDLALLQIEAEGLPAVRPAPAGSLRVGQLALAVGHPWGQRGMVTAGIVTGLGDAWRDGRAIPIIRSDVRLAPGNSGGPLIDAAGRVLGINTLIVGGDLGVAIPVQVVERFVAEALATEERQAA